MRMEVRIVPQKSFLAEIWPFEVRKIAHRGDIGGLGRQIRKLPKLAGSCPVPFLSDRTTQGNRSESESQPFLYKYGPCRATPCLSVGRFFTRFYSCTLMLCYNSLNCIPRTTSNEIWFCLHLIASLALIRSITSWLADCSTNSSRW